MIRQRRNNFTSETKRQAICECHLIPHVFKVACGLSLSPGNTFYEHVDPDAISGRNDLGNCAVLTKTCWKFKTADYDLPTIAKSNRTQDRARGIYKPRTITGWRSFNGTAVFADKERRAWTSKLSR